MKIILIEKVADELYESADGIALRREYGLTPNSNPINGRWVVRSKDGEYIDHDRYRNDLAERNNLQFRRYAKQQAKEMSE